MIIGDMGTRSPTTCCAAAPRSSCTPTRTAGRPACERVERARGRALTFPAAAPARTSAMLLADDEGRLADRRRSAPTPTWSSSSTRAGPAWPTVPHPAQGRRQAGRRQGRRRLYRHRSSAWVGARVPAVGDRRSARRHRHDPRRSGLVGPGRSVADRCHGTGWRGRLVSHLRRFLVLIVAVCSALAVGIALGGGPLQGEGRR